MILGHVGMGTGAIAPFDQVFEEGLLVRAKDILDGKVHALVIWGGEDISPTIYGKPVGPYTGAREQLSYRDTIEVGAVQAAIEMGIPIIGVCRGAQLLCALAGGELIQDVQGHGRSHKITTIEGREMITSSVHHQMMYPWNVEHELFAWSTEALSRDYVGVEPPPMFLSTSLIIEPEIVYFPKIKGLAIQGHPEFMNDDCEFVKYCNDLVKEYLL